MRIGRRPGVLLGTIAALTAVIVALAGSRQGETSSQFRMIFNDGFGGSRLNQSHWSTCFWWAARSCTIASNHELEWYLPRQVRVGRGIARLVADRGSLGTTSDPAHSFVSGMISSGPTPRSKVAKFALQYGRVEARMRIPAGAGLWPALWLLPADRSELPEIDVMEVHGQSPDIVRMHLHYRTGRGGEQVRGFDWTQPSLASGWHRFGIDWRRGRLDWLIDGAVRWHVDGDAVPRVPMYLIADLAVGGDPVGAPTARTPLPSALQIDWVRVWQ